MDGLVDGLHFGVAEGILVEFSAFDQQMDKFHNVGIHGEEVAMVRVRRDN